MHVIFVAEETVVILVTEVHINWQMSSRYVPAVYLPVFSEIFKKLKKFHEIFVTRSLKKFREIFVTR